MDKEKNQAVVTPDTHKALMAAFERVREIPPSETLIDRISDDDWTDNSGKDWKIECGSDENDSDELDCVDAEHTDVA